MHNVLKNSQNQEHIYSISELNDEVASTLTHAFGVIWVEAEISNLMKSAAGHVYFSLKDESASVRCAMFRMQNQSLDFSLKDGMQILARAKVGLYKQRGEFQLIIESCEELHEAFETLVDTIGWDCTIIIIGVKFVQVMEEVQKHGEIIVCVPFLLC